MSIPYKFNPFGTSGNFRRPLRLTAAQDSSSVKITKTGSPNVSGLKYRLSSSDPWSTYTIDTVINLDKDEYVEFLNSIQQFSTSYNDYAYFVMTGKIEASGNLQSMTNFARNTGYYRFNHLFLNCTSLITAPELPATTVDYGGYAGLFQGCISLISAPELPATTVGTQGYYQMFYNCIGLVNPPSKFYARVLSDSACARMFQGCSSLATAPILPTTTMTQLCYFNMFNGCTSLTIAPNLPATTLADSCYREMFNGCTSLRNVPTTLPATTLAPYCYNGMFYGCSSLIIAPELPALTMNTYSYGAMFYGCTSLTTVPSLPATTLASQCYISMFYNCYSLTSIPLTLPASTVYYRSCYAMFNNCSSLEEAPTLPATTLAEECYSFMFSGCSKLKIAPELPATTLATNCYAYMFSNCSSLKEAPELPATTLTTNCYERMFNGCTSLVIPPIMKATTLAANCCKNMFTNCTSITYSPYLAAETLVAGCYNGMFNGCTKLEMIKTAFTNWNDVDEATTNWVQNINSTGTFICSEQLSTSTTDVSHIPSNWNIEYNNFSIYDNQGIVDVQLNAIGNVDYSGIQYRKYENGSFTNWTSYPINTTIQLFNANDFIQFRNTKNAFSVNSSNYFNFYVQGNATYKGWIQSLMNYRDSVDQYSYTSLFRNGTVSIRGPILNVCKLAANCYDSMFLGNSTITTMPKLLNHKLAASCYWGMFQGCTSLATVYELPAKEMANRAYHSMFRNCTALTTAPEIMAEELNELSNYYMFNGCSNLSSITVHFTDWNTSQRSTENWVTNVKSTGTFTKPGGLIEIRGTSNIPENWNIISPYKRNLAYLESTGSQYIDLGLTPNDIDSIEVQMKVNATSEDNYFGHFGCRAGGKNNEFRITCEYNRYDFAYLDEINVVSGDVSVNVKNTYKITTDGKVYFNSTLIQDYDEPISSNLNIWIFLFNNNNIVPTSNLSCEIYNVKCIKNNNVIMDLIPIMKNDDVPCMYDKVNDTFKNNDGTGTFNYGEL